MGDARRTILERRAALMAAALVVGGPCERIRDFALGSDPPAKEIEEQAPSTPADPKSCLGFPHKPTPEELAKPDAQPDGDAQR